MINLKNKNSWYNYQMNYYKKEALEHEKDSHYFYYLLNLLLREFRNVKKNCKIMEIGCNDGRYTIPILKRGFNMYAIDISLESLVNLKRISAIEQMLNQLKIINMDIESCALKNMDFIFCCQVLHHVYDLDNVAKNIYSSLNKGGKFVCLESNPLSIFWYIHFLLVGFKKKGKWAAERKILNCTKKNLIRVFKNAGFSEVKIENHMFFPPQIINIISSFLRLEPIFTKVPFLNRFLSFHLLEVVK